jgi:hypothetical protein
MKLNTLEGGMAWRMEQEHRALVEDPLAKLPGEATIKLVQFDDQYETVFDMNLKSCPELTQNTFVPRGSTALLDAQGRTIAELGREPAALPEEERPSKVIVVTLTDGLENASKHYNIEQIGELIREQRDKYIWDFVFLGANQDAIATAEAMNIPLPSAMSYSTGKAEMAATMAAVSNYVGAARGGLLGGRAQVGHEKGCVSPERDSRVIFLGFPGSLQRVSKMVF